MEVEEKKCIAPVGSASHPTRGSGAPGTLWHPSRHLLGSELRLGRAPQSSALFSAFCSAEVPGATADDNVAVGADRHCACFTFEIGGDALAASSVLGPLVVQTNRQARDVALKMEAACISEALIATSQTRTLSRGLPAGHRR